MHAPVDRPHDGPEDPARWGDLPRRVTSSLLLVPIVVLMMWLGGIVWSVTVAVTGIGLMIEWAALCGVMAPRRGWPGGVLLVVFALAWGSIMFGIATAPAVLAIYVALTVLILVRPWLGLGLIYIGFAVWAMIWLRQGEDGYANLLFLFPVVWASDVGAYVIGRVLGGRKLAPLISPGKTWSGAFGGVVAACLTGGAIAGGLAGDPSRAVVVAALLSVVSQIGDLGESWAKRHFGVKDSGNLIPGHGGLLDRLDGLMAASFVAAGLAVFAGPGQFLWR